MAGKAIETAVRRRAGDRCEYCLIAEADSGPLPHVLDHVIARQHRGAMIPENLALACGLCNLHKGPNIAGLDPLTGELSSLFNPRKEG